MMQLAHEMILLSFKPLDNPKDNILELITELLTTISLCFYLLLTDLTITNEKVNKVDSLPLKNFAS